MHIAEVDDEEAIRQQIHHLIKKQEPDVTISDFATGEGLLAAKGGFDIIFLDIHMDGMDGIEAARVLRKRDADVALIFITGIKEYVFEAFDVSAFHYLLKPIGERKFMEVFGRALEEAWKKRGQKGQQIFVQTKKQGFTLNRNNILYIESKGRKVVFYTTDMEKPIEAYATMDGLEKRLGDSFYRCHRGYLVNMSHIVRYGSDRITLSGGEQVYLTKKKRGDFVKAYMWYLQNGGVSCV